MNDLLKIDKKAYFKTLVLHHFNKVDSKKISNLFNLKKKYNNKIPKDYIYLPNHYWKHKNHLTVFKSINFIKKKYKRKIYLVTTGNNNDYRFPEHKKKLDNYIKINNIEDQIIHLGIVDKNDVYCLMKFCKLMVNPSLCEGWGNAVDHAIHFKKYILLSKIPAHLEQNPPNGMFFKPKNYKDLSKLILKYIDKKPPNLKMLKLYKFNSLNFYLDYIKIISNLI